VELSQLLPWIMYGTPSGTAPVTYPLADLAPQPRFVTIDRGPKVATYSGCQVNRATIRGSQGEPLDITLDVIGQDETLAASGSFPALTLDTTTGPFIFTDLSLSINAATYNARDVEIIIDNVIDAGRFFNSQTLVSAIAMDRHVSFTCHLPYGDASAVYGLGQGGTAVTATFTGGGTSVLTLNMGKVAFPRKSPSYAAGRAEEMIPMQGIAYAQGATRELVTTLHN
jgi:hypothetical protein